MVLTLNEKLSRLRFSYLVHRVSALRWLQRILTPARFFQWTQLTARIAIYVYPPDQRRIRFMRQAMSSHYPGDKLEACCQRNIIFRKWSKHLAYAWPNWQSRLQDCVRLEGEEHLVNALAAHRGAVLLSGHAYGFNGRVVSVLTQKGYLVPKIGRRDRANSALAWAYRAPSQTAAKIRYGEDSWQHLRALKKMRQILTQNGILHLLIRGCPRGDPELEIDFYHNRFFLDPHLLRVIETLEAPVLPCFAICDDRGLLKISISPALPPVTKEIMSVFGPQYARYLRERPEFAWFWRRLVRQQEFW
jgi:lauroyl/myristoyl acyltransferase